MVLPESPAGDESRASSCVGVMVEKGESSHAGIATLWACSISENGVNISEG